MKRTLITTLCFLAFACTPKETSMTKEECESKGGSMITDPGDGSLKECPAGKTKLGKVSGAIEGALCCK